MTPSIWPRISGESWAAWTVAGRALAASSAAAASETESGFMGDDPCRGTARAVRGGVVERGGAQCECGTASTAIQDARWKITKRRIHFECIPGTAMVGEPAWCRAVAWLLSRRCTLKPSGAPAQSKRAASTRCGPCVCEGSGGAGQAGISGTGGYFFTHFCLPLDQL